MGRGRVTSQYAVREAKAPKPSSEEGDRVREDSEKEDRGRDGRRLHKSSDSDPLSPALERSDRNHSWKCITEGTEETENKSDPTASDTAGELCAAFLSEFSPRCQFKACRGQHTANTQHVKPGGQTQE